MSNSHYTNSSNSCDNNINITEYEKLHFDELVKDCCSAIMRGNKFMIKEIPFPNDKDKAPVIVKAMGESELIRKLSREGLFSVEAESTQKFNNIVKTFNNMWQDVIVLDCAKANKMIIQDTNYILLTPSNEIYRVCQNGQVKDQLGNTVSQDYTKEEIKGDLFLPYYNSGSGVNADCYLAFRMQWDGKSKPLSYKWVSELSKLLGLKAPEKLTFKKFIKFIGRMFLYATPSIALTETVKRFMVYTSTFGAIKNTITGKEENFANGVFWITDEVARKLIADILPDMEVTLEDGRIFAINKYGVKREVEVHLALQGRPQAIKGYAVSVGDSTIVWLYVHYNVLSLQKNDPLAQHLLDDLMEKGKLPEEYSDYQILDIYETKEDKVEYVCDMDTLKSNFDVTVSNYFSILKIAHGGKNKIKFSKQTSDKFIQRSKKMGELLNRAILREVRDTLRETFEITEPDDKVVEYIDEFMKHKNPEAFHKDGLFYRNALDNVIKKVEKLVEKMNPEIAGKSLTLTIDPSKVITYAETGNTDDAILKANEIFIKGLPSGLRFTFIKHPTNGKYEYLQMTTVSEEDYRARVDKSKISDLGRKAIHEQIDRVPEGICLMNVSVEIMSQIATFDIDGDTGSFYGLPSEWRKVKRRIVAGALDEETILLSKPKDYEDKKDKLPNACYGITNDRLRRFNIQYDENVKAGTCLISEKLLAKEDKKITLSLVPVEKDILTLKYLEDPTDEKTRVTKTFDFTEIEGEIALEIDRIRHEEKRTYIQVVKNNRPIECDEASKEKEYTLDPEVAWGATKRTVRCTTANVAHFADSNNVNAQAERELMLYRDYPEEKGFKGASPTFGNIRKNGKIFCAKEGEVFKGLKHIKQGDSALAAYGYYDLVQVNSQILRNTMQAAKTARPTLSSFSRFTETVEILHYISTDAVLDVKKTAENVTADPIWEACYKNVRTGGCQGVTIKRIKDSDFDKIEYTLNIDKMNKEIEEYNANHAWQKPYIVNDEGTERLRELMKYVQLLLYTKVKDSNKFENIADEAFNKLLRKPTAIVAYSKNGYYTSTRLLTELKEETKYFTSKESKQDADEMAAQTYKVLRIGIGNFYCTGCDMAGISKYEQGIILKTFSDKAVGADNFGTPSLDTRFYNIAPNVTLRALLKLTTGSEEYHWLEEIKSLVDNPMPLTGKTVTIRKGVVMNSSEYYVRNTQDGEYPLITQEKVVAIDPDTDEEIIETKYFIEKELKYEEEETLENTFTLWSGKKDAFKNLEAYKGEKVNIVAYYDEKGFIAGVFNLEGKLVIELSTPTLFSGTEDKELIANTFNILRNAKITALYNVQGKCLFAVEPDGTDITEEQKAYCITELKKVLNKNLEKEETAKETEELKKNAKKGNPFKKDKATDEKTATQNNSNEKTPEEEAEEAWEKYDEEETFDEDLFDEDL